VYCYLKRIPRVNKDEEYKAKLGHSDQVDSTRQDFNTNDKIVCGFGVFNFYTTKVLRIAQIEESDEAVSESTDKDWHDLVSCNYCAFFFGNGKVRKVFLIGHVPGLDSTVCTTRTNCVILICFIGVLLDTILPVKLYVLEVDCLCHGKMGRVAGLQFNCRHFCQTYVPEGPVMRQEEGLLG
jgi:hypothetical protein